MCLGTGFHGAIEIEATIRPDETLPASALPIMRARRADPRITITREAYDEILLGSWLPHARLVRGVLRFELDNGVWIYRIVGFDHPCNAHLAEWVD